MMRQHLRRVVALRRVITPSLGVVLGVAKREAMVGEVGRVL